MKRVSAVAETAAAVATAVMAMVTLLWPEWIELAFGVDPDGGSGVLEWLIVASLACLAIALSIAARHQWRRLARAGA